jgi:hypothetical protein
MITIPAAPNWKKPSAQKYNKHDVIPGRGRLVAMPLFSFLLVCIGDKIFQAERPGKTRNGFEPQSTQQSLRDCAKETQKNI